MGPGRLLARAWFRSQRRWWFACAGVLGLVGALVLVVQGTFTGMQDATQSRVADFFTGDMRVTAERTGAAVPELFPANQSQTIMRTLQEAGGDGAAAVPRYESQFILSRRNFLEAYFEEHDRYEIGVPGTNPGRSTFYGAGVLVGLPLSQATASDPIRPHMVAGRLPGPNADELELAMSVDAFRHYLSAEEAANLSAWPPTAPELAPFHFEVTAGRVDESGPYKDLIRRPARVVGLFATRLDVLDGFTAIGDIDDARRLSGVTADATNAISVHGGNAQAVAQTAQRSGWLAESPGQFATHYIGQLLAVLRALSLLLAGVFFALPVFLVWYGLQQMLDRQRRELGVCRAIGIPSGVLRFALVGLVARVVAIAAVATAVLALAAALAAPAVASSTAMPLPLAFAVPASSIAGVAAVGLGSAGLALAFAMRRARLDDLGSLLRAA